MSSLLFCFSVSLPLTDEFIISYLRRLDGSIFCCCSIISTQMCSLLKAQTIFALAHLYDVKFYFLKFVALRSKDQKTKNKVYKKAVLYSKDDRAMRAI